VILTKVDINSSCHSSLTNCNIKKTCEITDNNEKCIDSIIPILDTTFFCLVLATTFCIIFILKPKSRSTRLRLAASVNASSGSQHGCSLAAGGVAVGICHQSGSHTMTGLFAADVVAVAEQ